MAVTVAVNVTFWPKTEGLTDEVTAVVVSALFTVMLAVAGGLVPPSVEPIVLVVLFCTPPLIPVTFTENVQDEVGPGAAVRVPPDKLTVDGTPGGLFMVAVIVPAPHVPVTTFEASFKPAGMLSVNAIPLRALAVFGFVMVKLRVVVCPNTIVAAPNAFEAVGGATTVTVAVLLVAPGPLSVAEIVPVVLLFNPAVVPVTFTVIVHDPLADTEPFTLKLMLRPASDAPLTLLIVAVTVCVVPTGFAASAGLTAIVGTTQVFVA